MTGTNDVTSRGISFQREQDGIILGYHGGAGHI